MDFSSPHEYNKLSKFEINCMKIERIRAILRFRSPFRPPTMYENNFQILFLYVVGGGKEKRKTKNRSNSFNFNANNLKF